MFGLCDKGGEVAREIFVSHIQTGPLSMVSHPTQPRPSLAGAFLVTYALLVSVQI